MKLYGVLRFVLFALLFSSTAAAQQEAVSVPLKMADGKPVVGGVFLNGSGPYRFLLDTGSQSNHVDASLAQRLRLVPSLHLRLQTPAGETTVQGARLGKVTLGTAEVEDQEFLITDFRALPCLPRDVLGILGQEFLARFDYTLDLRRHQLTLGGAAASGEAVPFRLIYGRMAVPTNLGELVVDSGSEVLFLFRASSNPAVMRLTGASGASVGVALGSAPELRVGGRRYWPARAEYRAVLGAEEAGLLNVNLFHALYVSNSKHFVIFDPLP